MGMIMADRDLSPEELGRLSGRNGQIWRDYCAGRTQAHLAAEHGISQARVSQIIQQVRDSIPEETREEEVQRSVEMLRELRAGALEVWRMAAAPVFVGKDGEPAYDPELKDAQGRPVAVRDHTGRLRALETALKVDHRISQLLGLDAATKLDHTVTGAEERAAQLLADEAARRLAAGDE